jgi:hypothetical protein
VIGGISAKKDPSNPAEDDGDWLPENRLFQMLFGIFDIIMPLFHLTILYQAVRVIKEGHEERKTNLMFPISSFGKWMRNTIFIIFLACYVSAAGYLCYLLQSDHISADDYMLYIYIANVSISGAVPLILMYYIMIYTKHSFVNNSFRISFVFLTIVSFVWSVLRVYRGVHGIINNDVLNELFAMRSTSDLIFYGLLYFFSNMLPYLFLISPMVLPSFFLSYKEEGGYKNLIHSADIISEGSTSLK